MMGAMHCSQPVHVAEKFKCILAVRQFVEFLIMAVGTFLAKLD